MSDKFPVMLASTYDKIDRIEFPAFAQTKLDGMRANIIRYSDKIETYSRNGKPMNLHGRFDPLFDYMGEEAVLDGELLVLGDDGMPLDRKTGNGILHKAVVGTISPEEAKMVKIHLWDYIFMEIWKNPINGKMEYIERLKLLKNLQRKAGHLGLFDIVPTHIVNSLDEAKVMFDDYLSQGHEGIILKNQKHLWRNHRSPHLVKMKAELDIDLRVIDWQLGTGKYDGMMGALICESGDKKLRVSVGTGFNDQQRREFTRDYCVGKIATIKYNALIDRKTDDVKSLFLPVFVEFRDDKDVSD